MAHPNALESGSFTVLNPNTPMAYLSPDHALQYSISVFTYVSCLSVMIWDTLNNIYTDCLLVKRRGFSLALLTYFTARLSTLSWMVTSVVEATIPLGDCTDLIWKFNWAYPIAISTTSFLFFLRVRAFYDNSKIATAVFGALWAAVVGSTLTVPFGVFAQNIGPTRYCFVTKVEIWVSIAALLPLVNDTLVFAAITWRLVGRDGIQENGMKKAMLGRYLPSFSRALLQDGQIYYLTTVTVNLVTIISWFSNLPVAYKAMFTLPNLLIMNIMACRVFRNTILKSMSGSLPSFFNRSIPPCSIAFQPGSSTARPRREITVSGTDEKSSESSEAAQEQTETDSNSSIC